MNMKKQHFSLVELLTVIAVIAILAGILIPTVGAVKESGRATQALTEAKGIHLAITSFYNDHKYLPSKDAANGTTNDIVYWGTKGTNAVTTPVTNASVTIKEMAELDATYLELFDKLCYADYTKKAGDQPTTTTKSFNKKAKKYLNAGPSYFGAATSTTNSIRDPWGRPYIVYLDTNYNEQIEDIVSEFGVAGNTLNDRVAVISLGKNTVPSAGLAVNKVEAEDLCTSWQ